MMSKILIFRWWFIPAFITFISLAGKMAPLHYNDLVTIKLRFINNVKGNKIVLNDSLYTNQFGEKYTITKLRYYVTNVSVQNNKKYISEENSYHLIDESNPESQNISFSLPSGTYTAIDFLLGVDSLHNVSGAQSGDLDPAKDMFWTWHSGYVMAKMEGNSPASKLVNNKFEYHIGGFSGPYNALKEIHLGFPQNTPLFNRGKTYEIIINGDINTWWKGGKDIKISEHANITSPGELSLAISNNYANMFHIEKIIAE